MVATLIRRKVLYPQRLFGQYFLVVVDGTGVLTYSERYCAQCLTRTQHGQTTYHQPTGRA